MVQVLSKLHVTMAPSRDMKVTLDLVTNQTSIDAATISLSAHPRCLAELPLARLAQLIVYVPKLFPSRRLFASLFTQLVRSTLNVLASPLRPRRWVFAQKFASQGSVTGSVLHVHMKVGASHGYYYVEV
jgi:hypothetical protein